MDFKNREIFGDSFDAYSIKAYGHVLDLLIAGNIRPDGTVKTGSLSQLWSYIYLLYMSNRTYDLFDAMRGRRGRLQTRATAKRFFKTVTEFTGKEHIDQDVLIDFINRVIREKHPKNPLVDTKVCQRSSASPREMRKHVDKIAELEAQITKRASPREMRKHVDKIAELEAQIAKIKAILEKSIGRSDFKDIYAVAKAVGDYMRQKNAIPALPDTSCEDLKVLIYSKLCIIKYISMIMGLKYDSSCDPIDVSKQRDTFSKMSPAMQASYVAEYESTKDALLKFRDAIESKSDCTGRGLEHVLADLTNLYEDLFGSVRCFVRVRPFVRAIDDAAAAEKVKLKVRDHVFISMDCNDKPYFEETEFFGVYGPDADNLDIYTGSDKKLFDISGLKVQLKPDKNIVDIPPWAVCKTFAQLEHGYSIVFNAYGLSGSGKTSIYLGHGSTPGLLHYGLRNLRGCTKIELYRAFELYYDRVIPNEMTIVNKLIVLHDLTGTFRDDIAEYGVDKSEVINEYMSLSQTAIDNVDKVPEFIKIVTETCQNHMKEQGRIKRTPLNDQSSRSHLFLVFRLSFGSANQSYLTLADQAGFENAYSIYERVFDRKNTLPYLLRQFDFAGKYKGDLKRTIGDFLNMDIANFNHVLGKGDIGTLKFFAGAQRIESTLQKNVQILYESFAIVESLLHLRYFFNKRNGVNTSFYVQKMERGDLQYDITKVFKAPQNEDVFSPSYVKNTKSKVRCLMVPVLNYLDRLGSKHKVTKFVMFTALRLDKCHENRESLMFARDVKA